MKGCSERTPFSESDGEKELTGWFSLRGDERKNAALGGRLPKPEPHSPA